MRSLKYRESLEEIVNFCLIADSGIAIAEINDVITCKEFLKDLKSQCQYANYKLSDFSCHVNDIRVALAKSKIIVINELLNENPDEIIINLNYNRDWLLNLGCKFIIIVSPVTVSKLIAYSNNFWSCVTICKSFLVELECTAAPYLFDDGSHQYETKQENDNRRRIQKDVLDIPVSASDIVQKTLGVQVSFSNNFSLSEWLTYYCEMQKDQNPTSLQKKIFLLCMNFYQSEFYSKARMSFLFLLGKFSKSLSNRQKIDAEYLLGNTFYQLKKYPDAVQMYVRAIETANTNEDFSQSEIPLFCLARVLNNCGAALYKTNISELHDVALTYLNHSATNLRDAQRDGDLIWVLFNLSLISHKMGDIKNATYYIETAIENIPNQQSRIGRIICARFHTLYAYLLLSGGHVSKCKQIISSALNLLRSELVEQHPYIMDVHFVYATIFLQSNDPERALSCAKKAEDISKKISTDSMTKLKIWILLGRVYFYLKNYRESKYYLVLAARRARNLLSSVDTIDWINRSIEYCNKYLSGNIL